MSAFAPDDDGGLRFSAGHNSGFGSKMPSTDSVCRYAVAQPTAWLILECRLATSTMILNVHCSHYCRVSPNTRWVPDHCYVAPFTVWVPKGLGRTSLLLHRLDCIYIRLICCWPIAIATAPAVQAKISMVRSAMATASAARVANVNGAAHGVTFCRPRFCGPVCVK